MLKRLLEPLLSNSFFVFGARGTGKSTLVREKLGGAVIIDLLNDAIFDDYLRNPKLLEALCSGRKHEWIVIDEVQRLPKLLNIVQRMIEEKKQKFALTGSSSRKLRRGSANLLAGRAFVNNLYPFCVDELSGSFNLEHALRWGTLPKIYSCTTDEEKKAYLRSYCLTYVKEEIVAEQVVRKLEPFREFLTIAAQMNGRIVNHSSIAKEAGIQIPTVQTYYQILEETFIGFFLPHYHRSVRKSQLSSPKFYLFDNGVKNALEASLDSPPFEGGTQYGDLFESFVIQEIFRLNQYHQKDFRLSYLRTKNDAEIDLILTRGNRTHLVEIKSSSRIDEIKARKLAKLAGGFKGCVKSYFLTRDRNEYEVSGVACMNWLNFLDAFAGLK